MIHNISSVNQLDQNGRQKVYNMGFEFGKIDSPCKAIDSSECGESSFWFWLGFKDGQNNRILTKKVGR